MRLFFIASLFAIQSCSHVFYQPSREHFYDPAKFNLTYEDVWFHAKDGTKLHGWFFPSRIKKAKGTIIQFHGNAQNISTHFMSLVWLVNEGYNLFTFDYRGYGKSEGSSSQEGLYQDALAAINKGKEFHASYGEGHFIIYGQSLGGIVSMRALPDSQHANQVTLLVQDSTFASYQDIAFDRLKSSLILLPISPLAYLLVSDEYASEKVFDQILWPSLVIIGEKDETIPPEFGREIYQEIKAQQKWLWKLPEGEHINAFDHDSQKYRRKFTDLLDKLSPQ
jgi:fermentation-respiration switch protein FrsA (DUF1100 family)